jgi:EpsI family protein
MIVFLNYFGTITAVPLKEELKNFPKQIGSFNMTSSGKFDDAIIEKLGVDEYINRNYQDKEGSSVSLYIGYYSLQTQGKLIHSPKQCMPGGGWVPIKSEAITIHDTKQNRSYKINKMLFQKGLEKLSMLYWYQGRNRIVANEYLDRFFLVKDTIFRKRSEGALVRIIATLKEADDTSEVKQQEFFLDLLEPLAKHFPQ